jgi:Fe-S-cluster containining protein
MDLHQFRANVRKRHVENKKFFDKIQKKRPSDLDDNILKLDEEVFQKINCLDCGNCCKTTPSMINRRDVDRISKYLGMSAGDFSEKYVTLDDDDDMVYKITPCVFLDDDNSCKIYDVRPKACRQYPHTGEDNVSIKVMRQNVAVCPAVYEITEKLKRIYIEQVKSKS